MKKSHVFLLGALLWGCQDEGEVAVAQGLLQGSPSALDFGTVDLTQEATRLLQIANLGTRPLDLLVDVEDDCLGCFAVRSELPEGLAPGQSVEVTVAFRPRDVGVATATLTFSGPQREVTPLVVQAVGEGRDGRKPDVEVDPEVLDFGGTVVPIGQPAFDRFRIRSTGEADLLIDRIQIVPANAPFEITTSTGTGREPPRIAPGSDIELSVRALLPEGQTATTTAQIIIDTNVLEVKNVPGQAGRVALPVSTIGNRAPVAVIDAPDVVEPFSLVEISGIDSFDPDDPPDLPLGYRWEIIGLPAGSQARLQTRGAAETSFFADLTGSYVLELTVTDAIGLVGSASQVIEARPDEGIRIELLWDHPDSDVDLHLIREGGEFCDCGGFIPGAPSDVHYRCPRPNWYPDAPAANPILDVDDEAGFGPEVIILEGEGDDKVIPADRYRIEVHYYNDKSLISDFPTTVSNATVRVFLSGKKVAEYDRALPTTGVRWLVADLEWPSGVLTEIDRTFDGFGCGIF